ncbi:MAG TPA: CCA tRNA nucleotidyltransferase, partial [Alloiococcus sp.]|nr:CCA tRNA nucleotidyltransferase [Alloiococcus sp.]
MNDQLTLTEEFKQALPVFERLTETGYEAYFVGGSVRDALLGLPVNDVDIATSARPEEVKALFEKTVDIGIEHGTVLVMEGDNHYEITTYRTESTYKDFRRPDSVSFVRSLKEDLKRRDFTINAIAIDKEGNITDLFNGIEDLNKKIIRAVGDPNERFHEDALRMMRAVRFAAQLGFEIDDNTLEATKEQVPLLEKIAVERINIEWIKLLTSKARKRGLEAVIETKLYEYCPELANKKMALVYLANGEKRIDSERIAWSLLLYYIRYMQPRAYQENIASFLRQWKTSNQMIEDVKTIVLGMEERLKTKTLDPYLIFNYGLDLSLDVEEALSHVNKELSNPEKVVTIYTELPIHSRDDLDLSGHDLMTHFAKKPGPWLGEAITLAEEKVIRKEWPN